MRTFFTDKVYGSHHIKIDEGIRYAKGFEPYQHSSKMCCNNNDFNPEHPYFVGGSGLMYDFEAIRRWIHRASNIGAPVKGIHIFDQLKYLCIFDDFNNGTSQYQLPFTFY